MLWCPAILLGAVAMFGGTANYPTPTNTLQLEVQSCQQGLGVYGNATMTGLYSGGVQWGLPLVLDKITLSFIPHFGISHTTETIAALPSYTQFDLGGGLYASYGHVVMGIKLSHWSNGNYLFNWSDSAGRENVGINMAVLQLGWRF